MFPTLRRPGATWRLIGLSTARPSAPFLATGRLGRTPVAKSSTACWTRPARTDASASCSCTIRRAGIRCAGASRCATAPRCATCSLGAAPSWCCTAMPIFPPRRISTGRTAATLAIGVPSASMIGKKVDRYAAYHLYRIRRDGAGWRLRVSVRAYSLDRARFVPDDGRRPAPGARDGAGLMLAADPARATPLTSPYPLRADSQIPWARRPPSRRRAP